jgi:esterase/lipase
MEEQIKIPLGNNKYAYGILQGSLKNPLIIFVHGFTGYRDEHIFFNGARFFSKNNISSFRFNLYGEEVDARKLNNTSLSINAEDLDSVVSYFKDEGVKKIIVIGHSYGALAILLSKKQEFDKVVLWEPSNNPNSITDAAAYLKEKELYYYDKWGVAFTIGKEMFEENKIIEPLKLFKLLKVPVIIILAGNGELKDYWSKELESSASIQGATHNFDEYGVEEKLFNETLGWIK